MAARTRDGVSKVVYELVCENLAVPRNQIDDTSSITLDIGADSLDIIELVVAVEDELDVTIPDEKAEKIKTIGELIDVALEAPSGGRDD